MEATQTANPPSPETVWAILREVGKKQEELAESQKETARQMKETDRRLDKQLGKLGNRMGEIDVQDHIKRLEKMRVYADLHGDKRTFLGSVAGVVVTANVKEYALGKGLFVIGPSRETFNIIPPNGQPKEW
jgi:hypothetical protein